MNDSEHVRDRFEPRLGRSSRVTVLDQEPNATEVSVTSRQPPPVPERSPDGAADLNRSTAAVRRGPLLAVCGLCGGAGASTLAYLTALAEARSERGDVLLADTGGPTAGIAHYAGVETPRSLSEVSEHVAAGLPVAQLVATTSDGLRVLATGPRFAADCGRDASSCFSTTPAGATRSPSSTAARSPAKPIGSRWAKPRTSRGCCPPSPARWTAAVGPRRARTAPVGPRAAPRALRAIRPQKAPCASSRPSPTTVAPR